MIKWLGEKHKETGFAPVAGSESVSDLQKQLDEYNSNINTLITFSKATNIDFFLDYYFEKLN